MQEAFSERRSSFPIRSFSYVIVCASNYSIAARMKKKPKSKRTYAKKRAPSWDSELLSPSEREQRLETRVWERTRDLARSNAVLQAEIAQRKHAEEALRAGENRFRSILDNVLDGIVTIDSHAVIETFNRAAERIFGYKAEEVIGKNVRVLMPEPYHSEHDKYVGNYLHTGHAKIIGIGREVMGTRKDGTTFPIDLAVTEFRIGERRMFTGIIRDITSRKKLEDAKLQSERLAVIGTMSAKLAHEIRNPLSSVNMNIELVRYEIEALTKASPDMGAEARALLNSIYSEVRRIQRVTQDYLKFARIPKPSQEAVPLNALLAERLAFLQSLFELQRVTLQTQFDESLPPLRIDGEQFWQATLNLVQNAVEAMPQGGTLTVATARDGVDVVVKIIDTGKGMSEEERRQVFKPFFSTKQSGTGLGLPLTQQIIVEHGGRIECESVEGRGTTFTIRLPQERKSSHGQES